MDNYFREVICLYIFFICVLAVFLNKAGINACINAAMEERNNLQENLIATKKCSRYVSPTLSGCSVKKFIR